MELIDKLFWTSAMFALISILLTRITHEDSPMVYVEVLVFFASALALAVLMFVKIWA